MNIVLVDDHKMIRDGLRAVLEKETDLRISGEAADGREALELCWSLRPDVVVMDIGMPNLNGTEATRQLVSRNPRMKVVALSMNQDGHYVREMFQAGAWGFCVKSSAGEELVRAIRAVSKDERYVSPAVASTVVDALAAGFKSPPGERRGPLTPREREVLQLVAEGLTSKEIAVRLDLAVSTIETHRKQLMAKLDLRTIAELTKFAVRTGLTTLD
jgi:DNA-binding NarL/FixJ family response regulator